MSDPTFRLDSAPPAPPAGISASGLKPPAPPTREGVGLTLPGAMYAVGFVCTAALLWTRFNTSFGNKDYGTTLLTPMRAFQDASGQFVFTWDNAQRAVTTLVLIMVGYLILAFARPGRRRGMAALALAFFAFISLGPTPDNLDKALLFVACAGLCGAIFVPAERTTTWTRRAFWISLLLLGAVLWMPRPTTEVDAGAYQSAGLELVQGYLNPPDTFANEKLDGLGTRYGYLLVNTLPQTVGLLLFLLGLWIAFGKPHRRLRIAATVLLVLLIFGSTLAWTINAGIQRMEGELSSLQNAMYGLGVLWYSQFVAFAWPMAGAIREATSLDRRSEIR